ncbi:MAG TPA: YgjP-like metallopeptidase domain-containing protein [Nitrososphaerales archaeon]|nr:YgjP-like metallopeptidase domain-containing protein [Nitrososphaerales archaeon]
MAYSVIRGASRRYTYFRFKSDLTLEVVLPRGREVDPEAAVRENLPWITREYERIAASRRILSSEQVMYGGTYLRIVYTPDNTDALVPDLQAGEVLVRASERSRIKELIRRWFLKETSAYVVSRVAESAPLVGAKPSRVDVREINKWGYCTRNGRLSFSWQLVALPERLREYVVFHELTHLLEFSHSPAFKRRLSSVCPDFRQRERELDEVVPYDRMTVM